MAILKLQGVTLGFGGPPVLDGADLEIERGERLVLLGRNGTGKSSLLGVIRGVLEPDHGTVRFESGAVVGYLEQRVPADLAGPALEVVLAGHAGPVDERIRARARSLLDRIGVAEDARVEEQSAGLKRRVLLARALVEEPDLLLLDEPTNHLDIDSIQWLEDFLRRHVRTILFVSHDRAFLRGLATGILDLDRGQLTRYDADYERYMERKAHDMDVEARSRRQSDKRRAEEETWIRRGVRERRKRNQGRVRRLMDMRSEHAGRRDVAGRVQMQASSAAPSGRLVVEAKGARFQWEGGPSIEGLDATILRGDRIGIIGPNGSGKTTLLRLLLGELEPNSGTIRRGANLQVGYFDQLHAKLDEDATAAENVGEGNQTVQVNGKERHVVSYLGDFLFTSDQARGGIRHFSGGERNRLLLARLFSRPSNVLVLDEPTNDLDVETLEVLEDLLADYEGTVLLVSHDRELLDHVATSTLVLEGGGRVGQYAGGYSDWQAQCTAAAPEASKPRKGKGKRKRKGPPPSALSKEERSELRGLPARIEALEADQAALHAQMAEPSFFQQGGEAIAEAKTRLESIETSISSAYERWEALEAKQAGGFDPGD
ncbi:MAG: ATP-binding cassette domain-containing protein [Planctomycetota bacterium]|nr:ATP-binding cassette domain-containing protein [Planctomycetota bacterium]